MLVSALSGTYDGKSGIHPSKGHVLKIGSGWAKGQKLQTPKGDDTRPTSDKVRAAIFNALGSEIVGVAVIDLFAGSGALGIEALSRGALSCDFVEVSKDALKCLQKNTSELLRRADKQQLEKPVVTVINQDASRISDRSGRFGLVLADPPYDKVTKWLEKFKETLDSFAQEYTIFVLESHKNETTQLLAGDGLNWVLLREKCYGETKIRIWQRRSDTI